MLKDNKIKKAVPLEDLRALYRDARDILNVNVEYKENHIEMANDAISKMKNKTKKIKDYLEQFLDW